MAPRIHQLSDDLVARIAAGEVVERPASILKELIENSLDAGAAHISVAIEGAGRSKLIVSDDGGGMSKSDATLALRRHATSKISKLEDLESLTTFGFRGEALPSIAVVSRLKLTTRNAGEDVGWEFKLEGGRLISEKPVAREPGTTVEVRDVFFNTPARFKFLKSDPAERAQCLRVIEEMMFAALNVTFELKMEKEKPSVFRAFEPEPPPVLGESVKARLTEVWGARWARGLQTVFSETPHFRLYGSVTHPTHHQASPRYQFLFVNRRPVQNRRLTRALYAAYTGQLPSLRHPGWALFVEVDPSTVDVNVHPSKREVKLTHESQLYGFLNAAVKKALRGTGEIHEVFQTSELASPFRERGWGEGPLTRPSATLSPIKEFYQPLDLPSVGKPPSPDFRSLPEDQPFPALADLCDPELAVLAQVRKTFILARTGAGLIILDQHAAAEKAAYEKLLANVKSVRPQIQMLLVPFTWDVAMSLAPIVQENLPLFSKMGFLIEPFGGETFVVKGLPAHLGDKFDLHSLLDGVSDELGAAKSNDFQHRLAAMAACKASVKAGDALDLKACHQIIRELAQCEAPFTCPHGRPTVIRLPYTELERKFRR